MYMYSYLFNIWSVFVMCYAQYQIDVFNVFDGLPINTQIDSNLICTTKKYICNFNLNEKY